MTKLKLAFCKPLILLLISASPLISTEGNQEILTQAQKNFSEFVHNEKTPHYLNKLATDSNQPCVKLDDLKYVVDFLPRYMDGTKRDQIFPSGQNAIYHSDIPTWFRVIHKYVFTEWVHWGHKLPLMNLIPSYHDQIAYVKAKLDLQDGCFYSGLAVGPFSVMLNQTTEKFAISRADIKMFLETHCKAHETEMNQLNSIRHFMADLNKAAEVLANFKELLSSAAISKVGRIS